MKVNTMRFGLLEVSESDIIQIPDGILGFEHLKRFFIVDPSDDTMILWLQSLDAADIAFPILEPKMFRQDYKVHLSANEIRALRLDANAKREILVYCILTIPEDISKISANLKAPIVINTKSQLGRQVVLQENEYPVKCSVYKELLTYMVANSAQKRDPQVREEPAAVATTLSLRSAATQVEVVAL